MAPPTSPKPGVFGRWWGGTGRGAKVGGLLGLAGVACVALSLLPRPGPNASWLRDFLMTVGASLALFAPFYLITRSLDRHLDQVAAETVQQVEGVRSETAQQVAEVRSEASTALASQVEALRADVFDRLDDVAGQVRARLAEEAAADRDAFSALRGTASREAFWEAFERANRLGLTSSSRPPRINISRSSYVYVSVEVNTDEWADHPLTLRVETLAGHVEERIYWDEQAAPDVLVDVGRALYKHTSEEFDPSAFLTGLADLLEAALSHPERRPAVQLCPPQWMVCDWGVVTYDGPRVYGVNLQHLRESNTISRHVAEKGWADPDSFETAREAALALYPADPWSSTRAPDDPPF